MHKVLIAVCLAVLPGSVYSQGQDAVSQNDAVVPLAESSAGPSAVDAYLVKNSLVAFYDDENALFAMGIVRTSMDGYECTFEELETWEEDGETEWALAALCVPPPDDAETSAQIVNNVLLYEGGEHDDVGRLESVVIMGVDIQDESSDDPFPSRYRVRVRQ